MRFTRMGIFIAACCFAAQADVVTFDTPVGATTSGGPVDATAVVTTGAGTITVTLTNLQSNPTDVAQTLSGFEFTLGGNNLATGATYASGSVDSAPLVDVNANRTFTLAGADTTAAQIGWVLSAPSSSAIELNVLGSGGAGPAQLIIGPAGGSTYSNANGSIEGNGPHNPFIDQTAKWIIDDSNVTADTRVTSAIFSFGTTNGITVDGTIVPSTVPEPSFYGLTAAGLGGLLIAARRSSARRKLLS